MKKASYQLIDWIQMAVLIVIAPLFLFPRADYWWIVLIIPLLWIIRRFIGNSLMEHTPLDVPLLIFGAAVLIGLLRVEEFSNSFPKGAGVFFAIGFFYAVVALLKTGNLLKWAVGLFLAGGFFFSLLGLLGMPTFTEKHLTLLMKIKDKIPRIDFGMPGAELGFAPTVVGGILLLVIPLFLTLLIYFYLNREKSPRYKIYSLLLLAGLLITGSVLLLTQARGAWAGLFISTILFGLLGLLNLLKKRKTLAVVIAVLVLAGLFIGIGVFSAVHAEQLQPGIRQVEGTLLFRLQMWDIAVPLVQSNPWWGIGLNNFRQVPEVRYFLSHAHNQFLHVAVELGIPAMIAFMAILLITGYMCFNVWRTSQNQWFRYSILGLGWGQAAHVLFCLTDAIPPGAKVGIIFWISIALICVIFKANLGDKEQAQVLSIKK